MYAGLPLRQGRKGQERTSLAAARLPMPQHAPKLEPSRCSRPAHSISEHDTGSREATTREKTQPQDAEATQSQGGA